MIDSIRRACVSHLNVKLIGFVAVAENGAASPGAHVIWRWFAEYGVSYYSADTTRLSDNLSNIGTMTLALDIIAQRAKMTRAEVESNLIMAHGC